MIPEIFDDVVHAKTKAEKIEIFRKNDSPALQYILNAAFNPEYEWDLPEGAPPFKTDRNIPKGYQGAQLASEARLLYLYEKKCTKINRFKKETHFIGMLEALHWTEADFMIKVKDREISKFYKGVTAALVKEAFPKLNVEKPKAKVDEEPKT